ncbi:condensation domain-containing protein [Paenibacillus gansuensis]|uniref:Condensation domain-containing protein n=1 Tax=Paenibacillus gansuensis TaxID=306542 RepID=A0ABW5PGL9_9BACL
MHSFDILTEINNVQKRLPNKIAIHHGAHKITFKSLEKNTQNVAKLLRPRCIVGLLLPASINLISSVLGIMKANAVFVTIDVEAPLERVISIIKEARVSLLITDQSNYKLINEHSAFLINTCKIICIEDILTQKVSIRSNEFKYLSLEWPEDLAYISFTSGSTGVPKGVLGSKISLNKLISWEIEEFKLNESFNVSQLTSPSFGPFMRDIFVSLCVGATLHIPESKKVLMNPNELLKWLSDSNINLVHTVPSVIQSILKIFQGEIVLKNLHYIQLSGEPLTLDLVKDFYHVFKGNVQLINIYGQTETTLAKLFWRIPREQVMTLSTVPIGITVPETIAVVLNEQNKIVAEGQRGILHLLSNNLSLGYVMSGGIKNLEYVDLSGKLVYRTGDVCSINKDGQIILHGREDQQIKIRGMRVDLREIEMIIQEYDEVTEAQVMLNPNQHIEAYVIANSKLNLLTLRNFLKARLPAYMLPIFYYVLEKFPKLPSGKIDKRSLINNKHKLLSLKANMMPRTETEENLLEIWRDILDYIEISVDDNFFEIGGHSLNATLVINRIMDLYKIQLPNHILFEKPTIQLLSEYIEQQKNEIIVKYDFPNQISYPLTDAQKRIYVSAFFDKTRIMFNLPGLIFLKKEFGREKIENFLSTITKNNDSLRMSIQRIEGHTRLILNELPKTELATISVCDEEHLLIEAKKLVKPFKFESAPLWRAQHFWVESLKTDVLFLDRHHIISDGVTLSIILKQLASALRNEKIEPPKLKYSEYSNIQSLYNQNHEEKIGYWIKELGNQDSYYDEMNTEVRRTSNIGKRIDVKIAQCLSDDIKRLALIQQCTPFVLLLSVYFLFISKIYDLNKIIIGVPFAGRSVPGYENVMGMFVNMLPIKVELEPSSSFEEVIKVVKKKMIDGMKHEIPFQKLIKAINFRAKPNSNTIYRNIFSMQPRIDFDDILNYKRIDQGTAEVDLSVEVIESHATYIFVFEYCSELFSRSMIERYMETFISLVKICIENPALSINDIELQFTDTNLKGSV